MKQLLIVTNPTLATSAPTDGQLGIYTPNDGKYISTVGDKDFVLALGRKDSNAITIPVDASHLKVSSSAEQKDAESSSNPNKYAPATFVGKVNLPADGLVSNGLDFTVVLTKLGTHFNERNKWSVTVKGSDKIDTRDKLGNELKKQLTQKFDEAQFRLTVTYASGVLTISAKAGDYTEWEVSAGDDLYSIATVENTRAAAPTCDAAYVRQLASMCSQNRGFDNTYADGVSIYPGYPMNVPEGKYTIITLRFSNDRKYGRQLNTETVNQLVHIAVLTANAQAIKTAFGLQ